jgi:cation transport regulator ChaC
MKVFNYGSNMLAERLRAQNRAPGATHIGVGIVWGRTVRFQKRSTDGSGKYDMPVSDVPDLLVEGVLVEVPEAEMESLRDAEGVGHGYREENVTVELSDGKNVQAVAFVATADAVDPSLRPYSWYHNLVIAGAEQNHLSAEYLEALRAAPSISDPKPDRRTKLEAEDALRKYRCNK